MQISLSPDVEELIKRKIDSGEYRSADEVVAEALQLLCKWDECRIGALREDLALAINQIERGDYRDYDERNLDQFFAQISTEGKKKLHSER